MNPEPTSRTLAFALLCCGASVLGRPVHAEVLQSGDRALELAFPGCAIERRTIYLDATQKTRVAELAGAALEANVVHPYVATCEGRFGGVGYFDVHRVRTLPEKVLVAIDAAGAIRRVEVLSFDEPRTYLPRSAWYEQLAGKQLDRHLALGDGVRGIAGATLSARAAVKAARHVLALHQVLFPPSSPSAPP